MKVMEYLEIHRVAANTFSNIFTVIKYKYILGLTATMERLDGKHEIVSKYCPIVDKVTTMEAIANKWMAESIEYRILLDVADIDKYEAMQKEFTEHFEFFNYSFPLVNKMVGKTGLTARLQYRDLLFDQTPNKERLSESETKTLKSTILKNITYHATAFMRIIQSRKKFINTHPDKLRLTQEIIKHRPNAKIITFSSTIEMAEKIGMGYVYSGKDTKKKGRSTIEEFANLDTGVLNTIAKANEGLDCPGLSVAIILGMDSSPTKYTQRKGRVIRREGDKTAEIFTFVINKTVECTWFEKSHKDSTNYITIDEENLMHVLKGEPYSTYRKTVSKFTFRF